MYQDIPFNQVFPSPSDSIGGTESYVVQLAAPGKFVVEMGGTSSVNVGVYGPSTTDQNLLPHQGNGKLIVCGAARRGVVTLKPGYYLLYVSQLSSGPYTVKVRSWNFLDYFTINLYRSTCK